MADPAKAFLRFAGVAVLMTVPARAQEQPPRPPAIVTEPASVPGRKVSEHVAELLAASTPHVDPIKPKPVEKNSGPLAPGVADKPAYDIVRLPNFVVREPRVPSVEDVRTPRGLEVYAMNKYLGAPNSFSRAVLNRFTIADAWKHVPILGRYPWFSSPEATAVDMYYDDEVRKKMADLYGLLAIAPKAPSADAAPLTRSAPPTPTVSNDKEQGVRDRRGGLRQVAPSSDKPLQIQ